MTTPNREIRWLNCQNAHGTTAPPFALMRLWTVPGGFVAFEYEQQAVWAVTQPTGLTNPTWGKVDTENGSPATQQATMYVCNGPQAIEPGGFGKCTQDWPARVIHDSSSGASGTGRTCGPRAGSWQIHADGTAFASLGYDAAAPLYGNQGLFGGKTVPAKWDWNRVNTMWIAPPGLGGLQANAGVQGSAKTYASGAILEIVSSLVSDDYPLGPLITKDGRDNVTITSDNKGLQVVWDGLYLIGFQCTLTSSSAPNGSTLRLDLQVDHVTTGFYGTRKHVSESGYSLTTTRENVAFTGILSLSAGQVLSIFNTSGYSVDVSAMQFWAAWINTKNA